MLLGGAERQGFGTVGSHIFWTALDYIRILIVNSVYGRPQPEALVFVYFYNALNNLWFLWAVWWSFLAVYVMHIF